MSILKKLLASAKKIVWPKLTEISRWRRTFRAWPKKKRIIILAAVSAGAVFSLALIVCLAGSAFNLLFISPAEISLARLEYSFRRESICHEECALRREELEKKIVAVFNSDETESSASGRARHSRLRLERRLEKRLENCFLSRRSKLEFRAEIINIYRLAAENYEAPVPRWLINYLADSQGDPVLRGRILLSFAPEDLAPGGEAPGGSGAGRGADWSPLEYYLAIIAGDNPVSFKRGAVLALSSYKEKEKFLSESQLLTLEEIIFSDASQSDRLDLGNSALRQDLVLLLGDYYTYFPDKTKSLLEKIYDARSDMDNISRLFAADILNGFRRDQLSLPEVSAAEWEEYYKQ